MPFFAVQEARHTQSAGVGARNSVAESSQSTANFSRRFAPAVNDVHDHHRLRKRDDQIRRLPNHAVSAPPSYYGMHKIDYNRDNRDI